MEIPKNIQVQTKRLEDYLPDGFSVDGKHYQGDTWGIRCFSKDHGFWAVFIFERGNVCVANFLDNAAWFFGSLEPAVQWLIGRFSD